MTFLSQPLGFTPAEFSSYVAGLQWRGWKPSFLVLHNTAEPNLAQWIHSGLGKVAGAQRVKNLNHYYQSEEGWHSGPHIFVAPDLIWVACDLGADGVHASCYNSQSIGVEMVGDYASEVFDAGDGAKVRDNAVAALAILGHALGIEPDTLHFHKECLRDHHDCPGAHVDKVDMVARVTGYLLTGGGGSSGGAGASSSFAEPVSYDDKALAIYKFWLAAGFTPAQSCGLLAQADAESSLNPGAVGDHGQAFGLDQWHSSRVDAIRNGCGVDLSKLPPMADQLRAALWELQHTEKAAFAKIKTAKTAYDAGRDACRYWERPASTAQYAIRGNAAEKWAAYFSRRPIAPVAAPDAAVSQIAGALGGLMKDS